MGNLLQLAEGYVREEFTKSEWEEFSYHNLEHTEGVVDEVGKLSKKSDLNTEETNKLLLAAWFHDLGYVQKPNDHEDASVEIARNFLVQQNSNNELINGVVELINSTRKDYTRFDTLLKKILHDADLSSAGKKGFKGKGDFLRKEWADKFDILYENGGWNDLQMDYLSNLKFLSPEGIKKYDRRRKKNLDKFSSNSKEKEMATKKLGRGIETLYRTTYRNHINFSAIADNKANMMIGINAIILSIVLTLFGSGLVGAMEGLVTNPLLALPVGILVLCSSIAMVFAVLSARPNVSKNTIRFDPDNLAATNGILFFGNFTGLTQAQFNQYMAMLQENDELTYENMNNDLYNLGLVLLKKYRLLRNAYNIFMFGLILSILLFAIILVIN